MAKNKYKFLEYVNDFDTGESKGKDISPKEIKTRNFGKRTLHQIVRVVRQEVEINGKKFMKEKISETGGWIERASNLSQDGECWVGEGAIVCGYANVSGNAVVSGEAEVGDHAIVKDNAKVSGKSCIAEHGIVYGNGEISGDDRIAVGGYAKVRGRVSGNGKVAGRATVFSSGSIDGYGRVGGLAIVTGTVKDNAVVTGIIGMDGEVGGESSVVGNTILMKNGKVGGEAVVTGGIINGEIGGKAAVGTFCLKDKYMYVDGMYEDYAYVGLAEERWKGEGNTIEKLSVYDVGKSNEVEDLGIGWNWALDRIWSHDDGMVISNGREVWIDCRKKNGKERAERLGLEPSSSGWCHVFMGPDYLVDLTGEEKEDIMYFLLANYFRAATSNISHIPAPFQIGGKIERDSVIVGNSFVDGYVGGESLIVHDNSKIGGTVDGQNIMIYENSTVDGDVSGKELIISKSIAEGTISVDGGRKSVWWYNDKYFESPVMSEIEDSYLSDESVVKGQFIIRDSLVEGSVLATTFYKSGEYYGKELKVFRATVYEGDEFTMSGVDVKKVAPYTYGLGGIAMPDQDRFRLFQKGPYNGLLNAVKIGGKKYYAALEKAIDKAESDQKKYEAYLKGRYKQNAESS